MSDETQVFVWDTAITLPRLDEVMRAGGLRQVVNIRRISFISTAGLGFLIMSRKRLQERGGELVISQPSRVVLKLFATLGLGDTIKTFDSDKEALEYFGGGEGGASVTARLIPTKPAGSAAAEPSDDE